MSSSVSSTFHLVAKTVYIYLIHTASGQMGRKDTLEINWFFQSPSYELELEIALHVPQTVFF